MRRFLLSLGSVSALLLGACGPTDLSQDREPSDVDTREQGVLVPPPTPSSGNILDSTTFMGSVAAPGAVQTSFTTNPQYFSFNLHVAAGSSAKLEVTHLGSSMYLDTGLFVYGPKNSSGSYGTTVLAQDDDAGYGQLSKLNAVTLTQGGEYLVVVSSGAGAGKQFRLQVDCLSGSCAPPVYATCDTFHVGPFVEECMSQLGAEGVPTDVAFAQCFGPDDAHFIYQANCSWGSNQPWCAGGETAWTQWMWRRCVDDYTVEYGLYELVLGQQAVPANLQSKLASANTACGQPNNCYGEMRGYVFSWDHSAPAGLNEVADAVASVEQSYALGGMRYANMTYAQFVQSHLQPEMAILHPDLLNAYGNGTENVQVTGWTYGREMWPDACMIWELFVIYYPTSHRVLVFEQDHSQDC